MYLFCTLRRYARFDIREMGVAGIIYRNAFRRRWRIEACRLRSMSATRVTNDKRHMSAIDVYSDERKRERRSTTLRRSLSPNNEVTRTISFLLYCVTSSCVADDTRDQITLIKINGLNNARIAIHSRQVGQWPVSRPSANTLSISFAGEQSTVIIKAID